MTDRKWKPGQSGNPLGRPLGSRTRFSEAYMRDLAETWAEHGKQAMQTAALTEPVKFVAIAATLIPKDVQVTLGARLPGNLEPEDWELALAVFGAIREAMPDASQRTPGEVLQFVLDAMRTYSAQSVLSVCTEQQAEEIGGNIRAIQAIPTDYKSAPHGKP